MIIFLLCLQHGRSWGELSRVSSLRAPIPFTRAPPSWPHHPQRHHLQVPLQWELGFHIRVLRGQAHSFWSRYVTEAKPSGQIFALSFGMLGHTLSLLFKNNEEACGIIVTGWLAWPWCQGAWAGRRVRHSMNLAPEDRGRQKKYELDSGSSALKPSLEMDFLLRKPINPLCCVWDEFPVACSMSSLKRYSFIAAVALPWSGPCSKFWGNPAAWLQGVRRQTCGLRKHFSERLSRTFGERATQ